MGLITKSELASGAQRSRAAVTIATKPGGALHRAMVGKKVDASHPSVIEFIQRGRSDYEKKHPTQAPRDDRPTEDEVAETLAMLPDDIRELQDMSLRAIIDMFGTSKHMLDFLKAVKDIEAIHKTRLETAEKESKLISRDLVQLILDMFDIAFKRLLTDGCRTMARQSFSMVKSGSDADDVERYLNGKVSSFIKGDEGEEMSNQILIKVEIDEDSEKEFMATLDRMQAKAEEVRETLRKLLEMQGEINSSVDKVKK
jgi:hypothetical protein